jgi:hypothetical protein
VSHDSPGEVYIRPYAARDWRRLSEPVLLASQDLLTVQQLLIDTTTNVMVTAPGEVHGLLVYFEVTLGPTTRQSLHPDQVADDSFRYSPVWLLGTPLSVRTGDQLSISYRYRVPGTRDWVSISHAETRKP